VQVLSQVVVQQNESTAQIEATQFALVLSQLFTSGAPGAHSECEHVPSDSPHVRLSQTVLTSATQMLSQAVLQQNESTAQIADSHGSDALENPAPASHLSRFGAVAATSTEPPPDGCTTALMLVGTRVEARPKKKLAAPVPALAPAQTGAVNVNVISSPAAVADDSPIEPPPPDVTT